MCKLYQFVHVAADCQKLKGITAQDIRGMFLARSQGEVCLYVRPPYGFVVIGEMAFVRSYFAARQLFDQMTDGTHVEGAIECVTS